MKRNIGAVTMFKGGGYPDDPTHFRQTKELNILYHPKTNDISIAFLQTLQNNDNTEKQILTNTHVHITKDQAKIIRDILDEYINDELDLSRFKEEED